MAKSTVTQFMSESDAAAARVEATYHKVTWRLMSFIFVCWVLNYLDRVNVSFAQLHLKQDLGLSDAAYGLGVSLFFIGYISLEVPSTLWLKKIGARLTISRINLCSSGFAASGLASPSASTVTGRRRSAGRRVLRNEPSMSGTVMRHRMTGNCSRSPTTA